MSPTEPSSPALEIAVERDSVRNEEDEKLGAKEIEIENENEENHEEEEEEKEEEEPPQFLVRTHARGLMIYNVSISD